MTQPMSRALSRGVLGAATLVVGLVSAQPAQAQQLFTTASLKGSYSYVNSNDDVASFGVITFDGAGKLTLAIKVNGPDAHAARRIIALAGTGTYTVNADGTGVATISITGADVKREGKFDFVITESVHEEKAVPALATEVFAVQQVGGLHGQLVTPVWKRRAD